MASTIGDGDRRDFDEARRLLYMALLVPDTKRYNLAGTLVNALKHHHAVGGLTANEIADHVVGWLEQDGETGEHSNWLRQQIRRITEELGD